MAVMTPGRGRVDGPQMPYCIDHRPRSPLRTARPSRDHELSRPRRTPATASVSILTSRRTGPTSARQTIPMTSGLQEEPGPLSLRRMKVRDLFSSGPRTPAPLAKVRTSPAAISTPPGFRRPPLSGTADLSTRPPSRTGSPFPLVSHPGHRRAGSVPWVELLSIERTNFLLLARYLPSVPLFTANDTHVATQLNSISSSGSAPGVRSASSRESHHHTFGMMVYGTGPGSPRCTRKSQRGPYWSQGERPAEPTATCEMMLDTEETKARRG